MQPKFPVIVNEPGQVYQQVNCTLILTNMMNAIFATQRRSGFIANVPSNILSDLLSRGCENETAWFGGDLSGLTDQTANQRVDTIAKLVMPFALALASAPRHVDDVGLELKENILSLNAGMWTSAYISSPSLGYARQYMDLSLPYPALERHTQTASPTSDWGTAIASICAMLDRPRMSASLFPETKDTAGHDARQRPFGTAFAAMGQVRRPWALAALYRLQGSLFGLAVNEARLRQEYKLAHALVPGARVALEAWMENFEFLLSQPKHTLIHMIRSAVTGRTVRTYLGEQPIYFFWGSKPSTDAAGAPTYQALLEEALSDYGLAGKIACWGENPSGEVKLDVVSVGKLARAVRAAEKAVEYWPQLATELGWSAPSVTSGMSRQAAADYIITDGQDFSDDPFGALLGMRPCIAASNRQGSGFGRRYSSSFLSADTRPEWSVVPVLGYQGPNNNGGAYTRSYIPSGMWMGEEGILPKYMLPGTQDVIMSRVLAFYKDRSTRYVIDGFDFPASGILPPTDWEGFSESTSSADAQLALLEAYKEDTRPAINGEYFWRDVFYHRVPVRIATGEHYYYYDIAGLYRDTFEQDGHVVFDEETSITQRGLPLHVALDSLVQVNKADASQKQSKDVRVADPDPEVKAP